MLVYNRYYNGNGGMMMGAGGALTFGGLLQMFIKQAFTKDPVYWRSGGYSGGLPYNNS